MSFISFGDLAMTFRSIANHTRIRADIQRHSEELATGRTSDLSARTGGDLSAIAGIESSLRQVESFRISIGEAGLFADTLQRTLGTIQDRTSEIAPALLLAANTNEATVIQSAAVDAKGKFEAVISALNTRVANRALLSGTDTDATPLLSAEGILAQLQTAISTETTAAGVEAQVTAWFDDVGGGFETLGYQGGTSDFEDFRLGEDDTTAMGLRADDQSFRDLLKGYAIASLVADGALSGDHEERVALINTAGTRLIASDNQLAGIRAGIGTVEGRIENAQARNAAENSALELARTEILQVDPYRSATDLQAAETQLQTLYAITARLSRLSLTEFLR